MAGITTLLFDFWGTLVEQGTKSPLRQTYSLLRPRMGFPQFAEHFETVFMTKEYADLNEAFAEVLEEFRVPPNQALVEKLIGIWNTNWLLAKPYPDTIASLEKLKKEGFTLGLVANTQIQAIEKVLEKHDLTKLFDTVTLSYKEGELKTTGALMIIALERLQKTPEETVFIGDSVETDVRGAELAGITPLLIDRYLKRPQFEPRITTLNELPEVFQQ